jgi:subfamily B ATP-binding cassette protein MsbA
MHTRQSATKDSATDAVGGGRPSGFQETLRHVMGRHVIDREALKFLWASGRPHGRPLAASAISTAAAAGLAGVVVWSVRNVTQALLDRAALADVALWTGVALAAGLARSGLEILNRVLVATVHARVAQDIRLGVFRVLQDHPLAFYLRMRIGELTSLLGNDSGFVAMGVANLFGVMWEGPITALVLLGVMLYLNAGLTLVALALLPALAWCVATISRRARASQWHVFEAQCHLTNLMVEAITNIRQVKAFGLQDSQTRRFASEGAALVARVRHAATLSSLVSPAAEAINSIGIGIMAMLAYWQIQHGWTTPSAIVGCLVAAVSLKRPTKSFSDTFVQMQSSFAAARRILWASGQSREHGGRTRMDGRAETLAFDGAGFSYDGRRWILRGLRTQWRRGERVAVTGVSGSGKTTLLDLVTGFYPCGEGRILVNGRDLADLDLDSWRLQIGFVSQEPMLFDATIEENIRHGCPEATRERVESAARRAGCAEMLARLPDGLATRVGERGNLLSGGERKRVALARALVRPISVLALDEATGDLDPDTEERILEAIDALAPDLMVIHVSHRPSVLKHANRHLSLAHGQLTETPPASAPSSVAPAGG